MIRTNLSKQTDSQILEDKTGDDLDLKITKYGMSTSYIFNPKFSLKSITSLPNGKKKAQEVLCQH